MDLDVAWSLVLMAGIGGFVAGWFVALLAVKCTIDRWNDRWFD